MTNACNPEHPSKPPLTKIRNQKPTWLLLIGRGSIVLGGFVLVGLAAGVWELRNFIYKELVPLAESNLTTTLSRPVELGKVKGFSLTGVKFAASAIPATPTDPDKATVEAVEVSFDPLQLLLNRNLKLDVTLVNPNIYIEQDEQGNWITTTIAPPSKPGLIKTDLDKLRVRNANLVLVPRPRVWGEGGVGGQGEAALQEGFPPQATANPKGDKGTRGVGEISSPIPNSQSPIPNPQSLIPKPQARVTFSELNGTAQFLQNNQLIKYNVAGLPKTGGNISIQGETFTKTLATNLQLQADIRAIEVSRLIKLPIFLLDGRVQGDLKIQKLYLKKQQGQPQIPLIYGTASVQGVKLQVPKMPQPFINSQGNLRFDGTQIQLDNVATNYGKIPLIANGSVDSEAGFKLSARVNKVDVALAQETLKVQLPFPTIGEVKADLQVSGPTLKPIVSGTVATIKPAKIDKVDFDSIRTQFEFSPVASIITFKNIQGKATVGGEITGTGKIEFVGLTQLNFNLKAKNVAGDAIASVYDTKAGFQIGKVSAVAQLTGSPEKVQTSVQWQAPQATYPATGETIVTPQTVTFRNVALRVANGTVQAYGSWTNQSWQAVADTSQIEVQHFVNKSQLQNVSLKDARFNGRLILSGTSAPFKIATIVPENAKVQLAGGTVTVSQLQFGEQNFSAQLVADNIRLGRLLTTQIPPALTGALAGKLQVSGNINDFNVKTLRANGEGRIAVGNGSVKASQIQVADGLYQAQLQANDVALQELAELPKQYQGKLTGQFKVAGSVESFQPQAISAVGQARVNIAGSTVTAANIELVNGRYKAQLQANDVAMQQLAPQLPKQYQGRLTGLFNVAGSVETLDDKSLQNVRLAGQARVNIAGGTVTAANIQLVNGRYKAQLQANDVVMQQLAPQLPRQFQGRLTGLFNVAGSVETLDDKFLQKNVQVAGQARVNLGRGTLTASNIQVASDRYQVQLQAQNLPLQQFLQLQPQYYGNISGQFNVAGSLSTIQPEAIQATGQAKLNVVGGTIIASNIQVNNGDYQAVVDATGVELNRLSPDLRGQFGAKAQVLGKVAPWNATSLQNIRAVGQVQFSKGISVIEQPLTAAVNWDGQKLTVEKATSPDLNANGYIFAKSNGSGIPEITSLDLNVQAQNVNLQKLPLNLPNAVILVGLADFGGKINGSLPLPNIQGQLRLRDLVVNQLSFEPILTGNIQLVQGQGLNLDVKGNRDQIALIADAKSNPQSFSIRWQDALASGQSQGDILAMKVANFPLKILNLTPPSSARVGTGTIAGFLNGNVEFNQKTFASQGNLTIDKPQFGRIKGDRLLAQFGYDAGKVTLTNSEFTKGVTRYAMQGSFAQTETGPRVQGKLSVTGGEIQDILAVLQLYEVQDVQRGLVEPNYGTAADLNTIKPVGLPNQPLLTQIQRLSEIENLLAQQQKKRRDTSPIPELADLNGTFSGEVTVDTATASGLYADFNFKGQNFTWGRGNEPGRYHTAEQIISQGKFENGVLTLLPLRIESKDSLIAFTGNIGGKEQSGQLRVINFPMQVLNNFVKLPVDLTGNLNGTAALAGSINNPQAKGDLSITEGILNQKKVDSANASFNYNNGRLDFGSFVVVSDAEPVNITGSIPYKLPFATVTPDSNKISLDMKVKNEGLAVLNLLNNQAAFEKGEGEIDLKVRGTMQQPTLEGTATINNGVFSSPALPGKVTDVAGKVNFDFDHIIVENLQGKYNNQGTIEAKGQIPIFSQEKINNPLSVNLQQLAVTLKGLYQGGVSGNLEIMGSALNPMIGGQLQLNNGQVLLADTTDNTNGTTGIGTINDTRLKQIEQKSPEPDTTETKLKDLQLTLGKNVEITRPPILSFQATGTLNVSGFLSKPVPEGTIKLQAGSVNLFTTRFNLVRGYGQKAIFRENQPRDPDLDIQLFAKVLDVIQSTDLNKASMTGLGALETVRVEARVQGPASQLDKNLELVSSPARSQTEIVALLGGGVDTPGRGGGSTLGLINIAGSAVLNNLQGPLNQIGTALGLSELRIFPTIISDNPEAGRNSSSLELAAEAGVDITRRIFVSGLKILTSGDPVQWGINYRLNDAIRLRATTNFNDDNRAVVEYQKRF